VLGERRAHVHFFLARGGAEDLRRQRIAQRVRDDFEQVVARLHAKPGLEDAPRGGETPDGEIAAERAPVDAARVLDQKAAPLVFLEAAELQSNQGMRLGLDGERRVDFPQQVAGAQVLDVLAKIDRHIAVTKRGLEYGGHGGLRRRA
jgi:hypothetical protein